LAEQEASGQSIRAFCNQRGIGDHSFYMWRKRLLQDQPVDFAEVKTVARTSPEFSLELILSSGDRLRVANGADAATLRAILDAVRQ